MISPSNSDFDLRAADASAREKAQTEFVRPLVLEAGAGTGKTTTLVGRILAWALGPGWELAQERLAAEGGLALDPDRIAANVLNRVVAITFTEAAAAEMASRTARAFADLAAGLATPPAWLVASALPPQIELARRARALLATLDHLKVSTIHAFCRSLLAEHPLEAGVHPLLNVDADGSALEEAAREAVEAALAHGYGDPGDPDLLTLAARGVGPRELVEAVIALGQSGLPAKALERDPLAAEELTAFTARWVGAVRRLRELVQHRKLTHNAKKLADALVLFGPRLESRHADQQALTASELVDWCLEALPEPLLNHLKKWRRGDFGTGEAASFGADAEEVRAAATPLSRAASLLAELDVELLTAARRALGPLLAAVETTMRTRGAATFDQLLSGAAQLLATRPEIAREVRLGIDQLLIDEFQDTDREQCAILAALAFPAAEGQHEQDGRPVARIGLFLVGDPKQSIYGWRNADLAAYDDFVARAVAAGGEVLALSQNFRSVPAVLDEVARSLDGCFVAKRGVQPALQPLVPSRENLERSGFDLGGRRPIERWVAWRESVGGELGGSETPGTVALEIEASALARDLRELHDEHGVPWKHFGLLLRGFAQVETYLEALRALAIPFDVSRDRQYFRRREVIEAAALVRAVFDPGDHLALLAYLRSPAVGVPDAALLPLWQQGFPRGASELGRRTEALAEVRAIIERAADELSARGNLGIVGLEALRDWPQSLAFAMAALAELRRSATSDPVDLLLEKIRRLALLEPTAAARYLGSYRLANLERFFRRLLTALDERGDAAALLRVLRRSVAEALEAEEARPEGGVEDAVQVLTIHGAKGLDWEHVYLLQAHRTPPISGGGGLGKTEVGRIGSRFVGDERWEYRLFGAPTPGFGEVAETRAEVEAAERVRTLYVALTRAKVRVVVSALWPGESAAGLDKADSHAKLLTCSPAAPNVPLLWASALETKTSDVVDDHGVRWRFPALEPSAREDLRARGPLEGAGAVEGAATLETSPSEHARASAELLVRRTAANERQARPFSTQASAEAHARLAEVVGHGDEEGGVRDPAARDIAMLAGVAVHHVFERWDFARDPKAELDRLRGALEVPLAGASEVKRSAAHARATELLEGFVAGQLPKQLAGLASGILARELSVLLPPPENGSETGPVGFVSGAIDLLYRDPETGALVIADWKTDEVSDDDELAARARAYAPQGAIYVRAIREALRLDADPRFELWFVAAGKVVSV